MPRLEMTFLGSFTVHVNGRQVTQFRSANVQGLLIYLALNGKRPVARESLATLFWPDESDSVAKQNLRQSLYQLRKILGDSVHQEKPLLLVTRQSIQFNATAEFFLDVDRFLVVIDEGDLQAAVSLYTADLLPGFTCDSLEFEDWLRQERERLHGLAIRALTDLAERQLRNGRPHEAQLTARRHLALEPWSEKAHQHLIEALALAGDRSGALTQFERCREILVAELGVPPAPQTFDLVKRIKNNEIRPFDPDLIAGRYILDETIGRGSMGIVYHGRDSQTGQPVAIKMLDGDKVASQPQLVQRFVREGEVLQKLNHPNIVRLLAIDEKEGSHYLVMEYIAGGDLRTLLADEGRLPLEQVLAIGLDLADALTRAHRLEILHRDIKPANILLDAGGLPRLTDFGIARLGQDSEITEEGAVLGTIAYMSPEAFLGQDPDFRSDIWSFGVVLYEMLTGQRPYAAATFAGTATSILHEPLPDIGDLRPQLPAVLEDLLYRMLAKNRADRIPSVRLVGAEIEAILRETSFPMQMQSVPNVTATAGASKSAFATPTPELRWRKRHNLPAQATPFVGRDSELEELERLLLDPAVRLVSILGPGGMGKSRLMLEAAERLAGGSSPFQAVFPDGIFFVELAAVRSVEGLIAAMATTLGFALDQELEPLQQVLNYLSNKQLLLLLDNFEQLLAAPLNSTAVVTAVLEAAPWIKIVTTSREKLNLTSEHPLVLGGMTFRDRGSLDDALSYSAVQLFRQSAQRVRIDFDLTAENLPHVARICRLTEGMPLGIVLAAAWIDLLSVAEIAQEIESDSDFLASQLGDLPPRQRSMRAVFDYSWALLSSHEQQVFARLSIFQGGFSRQAAQEIGQASLRQLLALVNKSLIQRDAASGRFTIHELLQQLAAEKLDGLGKSENVRTNHARYYLAWLARHKAGLEKDVQLETLNSLRPDDQNILAAGLWAAQNGATDQLLPVLHALPYYFFLAGREYDAMAYYRQLLKRLPPGDSSLAATADDITFIRAALLNRLQDLGYTPAAEEEAIDIDRLLVYFQARRAKLEEALVYQHLGYRAAGDKDVSQALGFFQRQEEIYRLEGEVFRMPNCLGRMGLMILFAGDVQAARSAGQRFLEFVQQHNSVLHKPVALSFVAVSALFERQDYGTANRLFAEMEESGREIWSEGLSSSALVSGLQYQSFIALLQGNLAAAQKFEQELHEIAEVRNSPRETRRVEMFSALLKTTTGQYQRSTLPVLPDSGGGVLGVGLICVALTAYGQGNRQLALQMTVQAWSIPITMRWPSILLQYMPVVCSLLADRGEFVQAAELMAMSRAHPACPHDWWAIMALVQELEARLAAELPPEELKSAQLRGRELHFPETAVSLLEELKAMAHPG